MQFIEHTQALGHLSQDKSFLTIACKSVYTLFVLLS